MKKLFQALAKGRKRKESLKSDRYGVDAQDQPLSQIGAFRHYHFGSVCHSTCERLPEASPHQKEDVSDGTYDCGLPSSAVSESLDVENKQDKNSRGEKVGGNGLELRLAEECGEEQKAYLSHQGSRFKKNMYVISISNSQNFHIGSQKTINMSGEQLSGDSRRDLKQIFIRNSSVGLEMDWEKLLDCEEILNEEYIALIAVHMDKGWKEFGRSLGLEQTCLEEEDLKNGSDETLTVYDMLKNYLDQFPNTSLGFIISALSLVHHHELVKKLTEFLLDSTLHLPTFTHC